MRERLLMAVGVAALMLVAVAPHAQQDPYASLRSYDFQNRAALEAIQAEIRAAGTNTQKLAAIEQKLIGVLRDPSATFAARQEVCKFLGFMGTSRSVPSLAVMLTKGAREADAARYALERIPGSEASAALRKALATTTGSVRVGIINSLGARKDALAVALIGPLVTNPNSETRLAVVRALGMIATPVALKVLTTAKPRDLPVCQALLTCSRSLARGGAPQVAMPVITALTKTGVPAAVRIAALRLLAEMKAPQAFSVTLQLMKNPDPLIQRGAAAVGASAGDLKTTRLLLAQWSGIPPAAQAVLLSGWATRRVTAVGDVALREAQTGVGEVKTAAIHAAARCAGARAVPILAELAASNGADSDVALAELEAMSGPGVQDAIVRGTQQGKPETRAVLLRCLTERPGKSSMDALIQGTRSSEEVVAMAALGSLAIVGRDNEVASLLDLVTTTTNETIRHEAARTLTACVLKAANRETASARVLEAYAAAKPEAQMSLLWVLAETRGARALEELRKAAMSSNAELKLAAVRALSQTWSDSTARPVLLDLARNDAQRNVRVLALQGYIRLTAGDSSLPVEDKVAALSEAARIAVRPEEKRQVLGVLRECRTESAVAVAAGMLGEPELASEAAETVLDLAAPQKRNNRDLPAVTGQVVRDALDRIVQTCSDEALRERARKLR